MSANTPESIQKRVIFTIGVVTAMCPTAKALLKRHQLVEMLLEDKRVRKIVEPLVVQAADLKHHVVDKEP